MRTELGWGFLMAVLICGPALTQSAQTPEAMLGAALHQERVNGDLQAAIDGYRKVLATGGVPSSVAAQAQYHIGLCYEKLGDQEARSAFEAVIRDYADEVDIVRQAQARLAGLGHESRQSAGVAIRKLDLEDSGEGTPWNVSSDGRYFGATDYSTGNTAIMDLVSGMRWNVTDYGNWNEENGFVDVSAISRDGKRLAFWQYKGNPIDGTIRVVGVDGKGETVVLKARDFNRDWGIPTDWSPDGKHIAVQLEGRDPDHPEGGVIDLALVPAGGGEMRVVKTLRLAARHRPKLVFSPDGRYLAYDFPPQFGARQADLYVLTLGGGQETVIAAHPAQDRFVGWTPNGDILFLSDRTGAFGLYRIAMEDGRQSGEPDLLRDGIGDIGTLGGLLGVTAAGSLYYGESRQAWNSYFASIDFATGKLLREPERITTRFEDSVSMPSWSADGRFFSYLRHGSGSAASTLIIRDVASGRERELLPAVRLPRRGSKVRWHPDGKSLLAFGAKGEQTGLFRISADTGEATVVYQTQRIQPFASGDWSPDAKWYFHRPRGDNEGSITRRNLATGEESVIFTGGSRSHRVSPDGKFLAFVDWGEDGWLKIVPTGGGAIRKLAPRKEVGRFTWSVLGIAWTKDSRYLLFVTDPAITRNDSQLWVVPVEGGEPEKTELPVSDSIGEISFDPGSDRFAFSTVSSKTDYWVMENFLPEQTASR